MSPLLLGLVFTYIMKISWSQYGCFSLDLEQLTSYKDDIHCFTYQVTAEYDCHLGFDDEIRDCGNEIYCGYSTKLSPAICRYPNEACNPMEANMFNQVIIKIDNEQCPDLNTDTIMYVLNKDTSCNAVIEQMDDNELGISFAFESGSFTFDLCLNGINQMNTAYVEFKHLHDGNIRNNEQCIYSNLPDFCSGTLPPSTSNPTTSPTSPTVELYGRKIDVVILNDMDGLEIEAECKKKQNMVSETLSTIKGPDADGADLPNSRVAYVEFDKNGAEAVVNLNANPYNGNNIGPGATMIVTDEDMIEYIKLIEERCDGITDFQECNDNYPTKLYDALIEAQNQFDLEPKGSDKRRDRYIVIFSNCQVPQDVREQICNDFEDYIRNGMNNADRGANQVGIGINVIMINMGVSFNQYSDDYILCLTEYDEKRIYQSSTRNEEDFRTFGLEETISTEIRSSPSPAPTTDPTIDPTRDPTTDRTTDPTRSPTSDPTTDPTFKPTESSRQQNPTRSPSTDPTRSPSTDPTRSPSTDPTLSPTADPTSRPGECLIGDIHVKGEDYILVLKPNAGNTGQEKSISTGKYPGINTPTDTWLKRCYQEWNDLANMQGADKGWTVWVKIKFTMSWGVKVRESDGEWSDNWKHTKQDVEIVLDLGSHSINMLTETKWKAVCGGAEANIEEWETDWKSEVVEKAKEITHTEHPNECYENECIFDGEVITVPSDPTCVPGQCQVDWYAYVGDAENYKMTIATANGPKIVDTGEFHWTDPDIWAVNKCYPQWENEWATNGVNIGEVSVNRLLSGKVGWKWRKCQPNEEWSDWEVEDEDEVDVKVASMIINNVMIEADWKAMCMALSAKMVEFDKHHYVGIAKQEHGCTDVEFIWGTPPDD